MAMRDRGREIINLERRVMLHRKEAGCGAAACLVSSYLHRQPLLLQEAHPQQSSHKSWQEQAAAHRQTPLSVETVQHGASEDGGVLRDEPCSSDDLSDDGDGVDDPFSGLLVRRRVSRVPHHVAKANVATTQPVSSNHFTAVVGNDAFVLEAYVIYARAPNRSAEGGRVLEILRSCSWDRLPLLCIGFLDCPTRPPQKMHAWRDGRGYLLHAVLFGSADYGVFVGRPA